MNKFLLIQIALICSVSCVFAQSFANASFELPQLAPGAFELDPNSPGWLFDLDSGIANGASAWSSRAYDGFQYGIIRSLGSISQTVTGLVVGKRYRVTFAMARSTALNLTGADPIRVLLDGEEVMPPTLPTSDYAWGMYGSDFFVATAPTQTLRFAGSQPGEYGSVLDYMQIADSAKIDAEGFAVERGRLLSGTVYSLQHSDDDYVLVQSDDIKSRLLFLPTVQLVIRTHCPVSNLSQMDIIVESAASISNILQAVEMYDYDAQTFEQIDSRILSTTDQTIQLHVTDRPSRFVDPTAHDVKVRVKAKAMGSTIGVSWSHRIDKILWIARG